MTTRDPFSVQFQNDRNLQIGNICIQWSHLEFLAAIAIWSMLRIDEKTGKIITGGLDLLPRLKMAHQLAVHLNAPMQARNSFKAAKQAVQHRLLDRRNLVIHGHRLSEKGNPWVETFEVHRGKNSGTKQPLSNSDIAQIGKDIAAVHKALHQALRESGLLDAVPAKPARIMARNTSDKRSENGSQPSS